MIENRGLLAEAGLGFVANYEKRAECSSQRVRLVFMTCAPY